MQIETENLTIGEIELLQWQFGGLGSFAQSVWDAICVADNNNLNRLSVAFPDQVESYRKYGAEEGYWQDVLDRAGLLQPRAEDEVPEAAESEDRQSYDH